jgi:hypothetical protein
MTPQTQPNAGPQALQTSPAPQAEAAAGQARSLHRLSRLHDEAVVTAKLANLLGRTPFAAWLLLAGMAVVGFSSAGLVTFAPLMLWCLFTSAAVIAILRLYQRVIVAPFELLPLRAFAADLEAALLYAGVAWGAGGFLVLPGTSDPLMLVLFSAGTAAGVSAILRARASLFFLAPAVVLPALAAISRPLPEGWLAALYALMAGAALSGVIWLSGRWAARRLGASPLSLVTFS